MIFSRGFCVVFSLCFGWTLEFIGSIKLLQEEEVGREKGGNLKPQDTRFFDGI